jgi:hypothetical protein
LGRSFIFHRHAPLQFVEEVQQKRHMGGGLLLRRPIGIERRDGAGLAFEALAELRGADFDRDGPAQARIAGLVDFACRRRRSAR